MHLSRGTHPRLSNPFIYIAALAFLASGRLPGASADDAPATTLPPPVIRRHVPSSQGSRTVRAPSTPVEAATSPAAPVQNSAPAPDPTDGVIATPSSPARTPPTTRDEVKRYVDEYMEERSLFEPAPEEQRLVNTGTLIDLSVILDASLGTSRASSDTLSGGIALGDHDPHVRGFNARNEEFVVTADVDPYFYGLLDVVYKLSEDGESEFELEEAYALSTSLPAGLQLKIGQFFTEFGRMNPVHPHAWQFLNYPVILGRVFGSDGLRGQGLRLSWISPSDCVPVTLLAGVQNAVGETQAPFFGAAGDVVGNHEQQTHAVHSLERPLLAFPCRGQPRLRRRARWHVVHVGWRLPCAWSQRNGKRRPFERVRRRRVLQVEGRQYGRWLALAPMADRVRVAPLQGRCPGPRRA